MKISLGHLNFRSTINTFTVNLFYNVKWPPLAITTSFEHNTLIIYELHKYEFSPFWHCWCNPNQEIFSCFGKIIFLNFPAMWTDTLFGKIFPEQEKTGKILFRKIFSLLGKYFPEFSCYVDGYPVWENFPGWEIQENFPELGKYFPKTGKLILISGNNFPEFSQIFLVYFPT